MGTQTVLDLYHRIQRCFFPTMNMMNFVGILKLIEKCWNFSKTSHDNLEIKNKKKQNQNVHVNITKSGSKPIHKKSTSIMLYLLQLKVITQ